MFYNDDDDNYSRCLGLTSISYRLNTLGTAQRLLLLLHTAARAPHQLQHQGNLHYISISGTLDITEAIHHGEVGGSGSGSDVFKPDTADGPVVAASHLLTDTRTRVSVALEVSGSIPGSSSLHGDLDK